MLQPPSKTLGARLLMVTCTHQNYAFSQTPFQGLTRLTQQIISSSQAMVENCK
jgi:hypothetical protein